VQEDSLESMTWWDALTPAQQRAMMRRPSSSGYASRSSHAGSGNTGGGPSTRQQVEEAGH